MRSLIQSLSCAAVLSASVAFAQTGSTGGGTGRASAGSSSSSGGGNAMAAGGASDILTTVHLINHDEVEMGKLAKSHASNKAVKDYGDMLMKDHQASDKELMALSKSKKIHIDSTAKTDDQKAMAQKDHDEMAKLKKRKGADFDKEFLSAMVAGHDEAISKVKSAQGSAGDANDFLTSLLPKLQSHRDQAAKLQGGSM